MGGYKRAPLTRFPRATAEAEEAASAPADARDGAGNGREAANTSI